MAETPLTASEADALSGVTDSDLDFTYLTIGESPYYTGAYRCWARLVRVVKAVNAFRVYKDGDLTFGVRPGRYTNGDAEVAYSGATGQGLTNNATNYVYLTASGTLTVNTTGFPAPDAAPHVPLATIVTAGGEYGRDDLTDYRGRALFQVVRAPAAVRPAVRAAGAVYFTGRPADDEVLTINGRKYETDDDGDFPQASGDVQCDLSGNATVDEDITDIAAAINGDGSADVTAVADIANDVLWLYAAEAGASGNAITLATDLTNTIAGNSTLADGADAAVAQVLALRHTLTAAEAAVGLLRFDTGLSSIDGLQVMIGQGNVLGDDVTVAAAGGVITLGDSVAQWNAGEVLHVLAVGTL